MAQSRDFNPLTEYKNPLDNLNWAQNVISLIEETVATHNDVELSPGARAGLFVTLRWVRQGIENAVEKISEEQKLEERHG